MKKFALVLALCSASAHAEYKDGNKLLEELMSPDVVPQMVALGYVEGVADVWQNISVCIPLNVQAKQVADVVKNYLWSNPQNRQYSADSLAIEGLKAVWPCTSNNTSKGRRM